MRAKILMILYVSWMGALTIAYYARPSWHVPVWSMIGALSAAAVIVGVVRYRPRRREPWILLSIALFCFAAGDTTYNLLTSVGHEVNPFPSAADLFYLVTCVTQVAAMVGLVRAGTAVRDRSAFIDSLILATGFGVLYWIFLIGPKVHSPDLTALQKLISIAYPLTDVILLALVARLVVVARRTPSVLLLAIGFAGLLEADVAYGLSQIDSSWHIGGPVDLGWIVYYACVGAAALHPSMFSLTQPRTTRPVQMGRARLLLLGLSAMIAPAVLITESVRGSSRDVKVVAALSGVVFLFVMVRLAEVLASNRLALARERALRQSGDALVSATDPDAVRAAVEAAVARMVPSGQYAVDLLDDTIHTTGPTSGAEMRYTATLGPDVIDSVRLYELALVCAPPVRDLAGRVRAGASLVLASHESMLSAMTAPVEVLAAQATLALERIRLTDEVNRRKSEEYFRTLVQNTADVILIIDQRDIVRYASPSAPTILGDQRVVGRRLDALLTLDAPVPSDDPLALMRPTTLGGIRTRESNVDWIVNRPDDKTVRVEASTQDLTDDPTVNGVVVTLRDVTDRRRLEQELTHHAFHDPLTGIANRLLFQERAKAAVARAYRQGATVGVLFIDLDDFKIVNDTMGHHAGDQLLVAVVKRFTEVLRPSDSAARLGGDEFAVLIEEVNTPGEVEAVADRVIGALVEPFVVGESLVSGAASIGVATTAEATDSQELLRQADLALYVAKGSGKGQWRRYQAELHTAVLKRMQVRTELDQAVKDNSFELLYQPIVRLVDGQTVGFEALVRWVHPRLGVIQPVDFIDVAEESGLIVPMGDWILRTAIDTAASWPDPETYVSVNVSVRQFRTPGFIDSVRAHLASSGLPPSRLMLEITESLLLPDEVQVWNDLNALRAMGVQIAIDDFGTGYSSLSYLRRVPVNVVKVDKSFVETIGSSEQQRELVRGIVWLAATLGLQVIAEGIETTADRDLLVTLGCPLGQGYLFSPPMTQISSIQWRAAERIVA